MRQAQKNREAQAEPRIDGADIRSRRKALGLSQAQLARRLDVTEDTIWRWETGKATIAHPAMLRLALDALAHQQP